MKGATWNSFFELWDGTTAENPKCEVTLHIKNTWLLSQMLRCVHNQQNIFSFTKINVSLVFTNRLWTWKPSNFLIASQVYFSFMYLKHQYFHLVYSVEIPNVSDEKEKQNQKQEPNPQSSPSLPGTALYLLWDNPVQRMSPSCWLGWDPPPSAVSEERPRGACCTAVCLLPSCWGVIG